MVLKAGSGSALKKPLDPDSHEEKTAGSGSMNADPQPWLWANSSSCLPGKCADTPGNDEELIDLLVGESMLRGPAQLL